MMKFTDYAQEFDSYLEALQSAVGEGYSINKYADPEEGGRTGLEVAEAASVAREDASLLWLAK